ncbi:hypothetical protein [Amycolatopsis sp. NPDC051716]|uniref:hypothetical protein n=1 Tax=Amycolatopsis sp. NPDC051716 TaxID=3155804 RepID=UPI0034140761
MLAGREHGSRSSIRTNDPGRRTRFTGTVGSSMRLYGGSGLVAEDMRAFFRALR